MRSCCRKPVCCRFSYTLSSGLDLSLDARDGDPGGTRTPYLQIRNLSLYPDELRDHKSLMPEFIIECQPAKTAFFAAFPCHHRI